MPDVEGGIPAARKERWNLPRSTKFSTRLIVREVFSAGLEAPALRQARMPAATAELKQLRDLHIELKVKPPTPPVPPKT